MKIACLCSVPVLQDIPGWHKVGIHAHKHTPPSDGPDKWKNPSGADSLRPASSSGKSSSFIPPPLHPLHSLHLTPQCLRIKMTTHFQRGRHTYTHTLGTSEGSVRGRYRPAFITDFTHVSNHKIEFHTPLPRPKLSLSIPPPSLPPLPLHPPFTPAPDPNSPSISPHPFHSLTSPPSSSFHTLLVHHITLIPPPPLYQIDGEKLPTKHFH